MPALQRSSAPRGPRFYDDEDGLMFVLVLDAATRHGPRLATSQDKEDHPDAWAVYEGVQADSREAFPAPVTFSTPEGGAPPRETIRAKGEKAPV